MITRTLQQTVCAAVLAVAAVGQTLPLAEQVTGRLRADALKADVSFLASDALQGRLTPSPELEIAAEFVAAQFRRAGLQPAGDNEYFQTVDYRLITPKVEGFELSFNMGGAVIVADKTALVPMGPPQHTAFALTGAEIVRAPTTLEVSAWDAMTPDQLRGKALYVERVSPIAWSSIARLRPSLVVTSTPPLRGSGYEDYAVPTLAEVLASLSGPRMGGVQMWDGFKGFRVWDPAALAALRQGTGGTVSVKIPAPVVRELKMRNVIGVLRGSDLSLRETYVLVTAHYDGLGVLRTGEGDRILNGANDNASGTAALIEIADALSSLSQRPKRSIAFIAFFGEEVGMLGSISYTKHPTFPLEKTVANVNLEMLGRTDVESGIRAGQVNASGFDYTSITEVIRQAGLEAGINVVKNETRSESSYYPAADSGRFAEAGIPATTLSIGSMLDYHKPGDEWQKLDYNNMANVTRAIALGIYRLADSNDTPQWNRQNPETQRYVQAQEKAASERKAK